MFKVFLGIVNPRNSSKSKIKHERKKFTSRACKIPTVGTTEVKQMLNKNLHVIMRLLL